mmetsp:Transcript_3571/g.4621  ORF Transcript_3571/g.4621 Transcript_3571/m.4621 type:complete len:209 (-) Transcript_3571:286-912(-)
MIFPRLWCGQRCFLFLLVSPLMKCLLEHFCLILLFTRHHLHYVVHLKEVVVLLEALPHTFRAFSQIQLPEHLSPFSLLQCPCQSPNTNLCAEFHQHRLQTTRTPGQVLQRALLPNEMCFQPFLVRNTNGVAVAGSHIHGHCFPVNGLAMLLNVFDKVQARDFKIMWNSFFCLFLGLSENIKKLLLVPIKPGQQGCQRRRRSYSSFNLF